jgi:two-component system NarL family response regulator
VTQFPNASILVVDDFKPWRDEIRRILQARQEWKIVSEARDGLEAVRQATELQPDVVLLDLALPTLNGIDAAKIIRERCPKSRIVFVTENTDSEIREAAIGTGASGYVVKSNVARDLLDAIAAALRSA